MKKTLLRIYVKTGWNRLHIIPMGRFGQGQVFSVRVPNDNRTIIGADTAACAQVQVDIPGLPTHFGGEIAHLAFD